MGGKEVKFFTSPRSLPPNKQAPFIPRWAMTLPSLSFMRKPRKTARMTALIRAPRPVGILEPLRDLDARSVSDGFNIYDLRSWAGSRLGGCRAKLRELANRRPWI